jgi:hypothetical protein
MSNGQSRAGSDSPRTGNHTNQYAFPNPEKAAASEVQHGMTLRDYFAGIAMQALVGRETEILAAPALPGVRIATLAYDIANAMIDQRGS